MGISKKAKGSSSSNKLGRWLGAPVRALSRAADTYVRQMTACAGRMPTPAGAYGGDGGFALAPGTLLAAATFSSRSGRRRGGDDEDGLNELFRALSLRQAAAAAATTVPVRSRSVAVGRIDEDAPCEFGADDVVRVGGPAVRRARSVAMGGVGLAARAGYSAAYKPGSGVVRS